MNIIGNGGELVRGAGHPYINRPSLAMGTRSRAAVATLNRERNNTRGPAVTVTYYFEVAHAGAPMEGLKHTAQMLLEHGTLKPWRRESDAALRKPADYDEFMSWAVDIRLIGYNKKAGMESGLVRLAYPLKFFDKCDQHRVPLSQLFMAIASEPASAFSFLRGARIVDIHFPPAIRRRFPVRPWPHRRVREYLQIRPNVPIIGTIVKPKTGLTPELFSKCVVTAAKAGAHFTKADENMHLTLRDIPRFVGRVVRDLQAGGFDLGRGQKSKGRRFLFAPHITTDSDLIMDYAAAAVEAGANALMFSPYYGGGFLKMAEIAERFDVPVYAHTAGMNIMTGCPVWGIDPRVMYLLSALFGAAFMQITTMNGYLKPDDREKAEILRCLRENGLEGDDGMTLAIAGGLGPENVGSNMKLLGEKARMLLAGTSVYSHPDGPSAGVRAILLAHQAYRERGITEKKRLKEFAKKLGNSGLPLAHAL